MCSKCGVLKGCCECNPSTVGATGASGTDGSSAYDIWIAEGNVGSEAIFLESLIGATGATGADGIDGVPNPKINFYSGFVNNVYVSDNLPDPTVYSFPAGYTVNSYTNSTGIARDYIVHGSFDTMLQVDNNDQVVNHVDGALIKTVSAVDSVEWEHKGKVTMSLSLFDDATVLDVVDIGTSTNKVYSEFPSGTNVKPVEARFAYTNVPKNVAFFKKVTLNDGESISLKFKTNSSGLLSLLTKA